MRNPAVARNYAEALFELGRKSGHGEKYGLLLDALALWRGPAYADVAGLPYAIDRVLHFSNGGGVYLARDTRTGEAVVLKEARPHAGVDARGHDAVRPLDSDLTLNAVRNGEAIGERIIVAGRVLDEDGHAVPDTLIEIWQANAAGRYVHKVDQHDAPLDPNFLGSGRCLTDADGRYRFITVKPGAYPWGNHPNAWRPNHIHFSLFGTALTSRLVTQMYFPGDPLLPMDPIFNGVPDERGRERFPPR